MSDFAIQMVADSKLSIALAKKMQTSDHVELLGVKVHINQIDYYTSGAIKYATLHGREVE